MENEKQTKKTRRPYQKPQLKQVQLVAEEAVLQNCKTRPGAGSRGCGGVGNPSVSQGS